MAEAPETSADVSNANPTLADDNAKARARRFFLAALALFLLWVAALVGLAIISGHRPMDRAGAVPPSVSPDHEGVEPGS